MHLGQLWAVLPQVDVLQAGRKTTWKKVQVRGVACDSRCIVPGDVFVAVAGSRYHGSRFVADAVRQGAVAVMVDQDVSERAILAEAGPCVPVARVPDPRRALALLAHAVTRQPSHKLDVIGVTGTNGKTTTAKMIQSILTEAGRRPAFLGTVGYEVGDRRLPAPTTTPPAPDLVRMLQEAVTRGHDAVALEVSSHGLDQHRVTGTRFRAAAFTGLSRDHQDYHGSMEHYFESKRSLFEMVEPDGPSVVQVAGPAGRRLSRELESQGRRVVTCGAPGAEVRAEAVVIEPDGSRFRLCAPTGGREVHCPLPGRFNVANAVTAAALGLALGLDLETVASGLRRLPPVDGRMERFPIPGRDAMVVVDYAHTHEGLAAALQTLAEARETRKRGSISVLFGCGGDRDPGRRSRMGAVAARHADRVIVTSDNPRSEEPERIIQDILSGVPVDAVAEVVVEPDRRKAIRMAVEAAGPGDVILVAGKGHEDYQIFKDVTIPFDDRDQVRRAIEEHSGCDALAGGSAAMVQGFSGQAVW